MVQTASLTSRPSRPGDMAGATIHQPDAVNSSELSQQINQIIRGLNSFKGDGPQAIMQDIAHHLSWIGTIRIFYKDRAPVSSLVGPEFKALRIALKDAGIRAEVRTSWQSNFQVGQDHGKLTADLVLLGRR